MPAGIVQLEISSFGLDDDEPRWTQQIWQTEGTNNGTPQVDVDGVVLPSGDVVLWVTSLGGETVDFGNGPSFLTPGLTALVGYSPSGEFVWWERFRGSVRSGHVRSDGTLAIVRSTPTADGSSLEIVQIRSIDGTVLAEFEVPAASSYAFTGESAVAGGRFGGLYFAGTVGPAIDLGGGLRTPLFDGATLVAYGPRGEYRYDRVWSEPGTSTAFDLATRGEHVLLSGTFSGTLDFGGGPQAGDNSPFLVLLRD